MTRLIAYGSVVIAAPFVIAPRLGALAVVVVTTLLLARAVWRRMLRAHEQVLIARRSALRADELGFVNPRPPGRHRSPDFQWVTRAGPESTPRVLDHMPHHR